MDLGIEGKWALVCAASKGLGKGCATALANEGVNVVITARGADVPGGDGTRAARARPRRDPRCRRRHHDRGRARCRARGLSAGRHPGPNNAGGPPPGDFREWGRDAWLRALDANMLTPIELIKATVDKMAERGHSATSSTSFLGLGEGADRWCWASRTARAAGLARASSPAIAPDPSRRAAGSTVNSLLPGWFRHRPCAPDGRGRRPARRQHGRGVHRGEEAGRSGAAPRHDRGVRGGLRFPLQRARRLHHRPEPVDGRRGVSGDVLICH